MAPRRETAGEGTGRRGPWKHEGPDHPREGRGGDIHDLDVENDPRGGEQSDAYRTADPRELVVEGDTAMMGPGGTPVGEMEAVEVLRDPALDEKALPDRDA